MTESVRRVTHHIPGARQALTLVAAATLAACGGGGGGGSDGGGGPTTLALSGSAATGAAIAGGTVDAKCAAGSGTATTGSDGSYSLSITSGRLPCLLRVTSGATVLHSVVAGSGSSAVGHLTPATQLIVARLAAADPAAYYTAFDATAAAAVTTAAVADAQAAVVATLKPAGVDFGTITDLVGGALRPKVGTAAGDAYDQLLDALAARLAASGVTLGGLTTALIAEAASLGTATPSSGTVSLPPGMLLQPAASNCSALRSGTYRVVNPTANSDLANQSGLLTLNATTLISRDAGSTTDNPVWVPNGPCRYLTDNGTTDIAVSQAGVLVARTSNGGNATRVLAVGFPEQNHKLAELAGTWNMIGMQRNAANTGYTGVAGTGTIDSNGGLSAVTHCQNDSTWSLKSADCAVQPGPFFGLRLNASGGGFDIVDPGSTVATGRQFAYRAGNGDLMMFGVDGDGSVNVYTRQRTNTLPTIGAATASWNFYAGPQLTSTQVVDVSSNVVASVDATAGSFLRNQIVGTGTVTRPETLFINNPRNGYTFRVGGSVVNSAGVTVNVSEFTSLPLRGMGMSAVVFPTSKLFLLSLTQPN